MCALDVRLAFLASTDSYSLFKTKLTCFWTKFLLLDNKLPVTRFSCLLTCCIVLLLWPDATAGIAGEIFTVSR